VSSPTFTEAREAVARWLESSRGSLVDRGIVIGVVRDIDACLAVVLNFGECVADVVVEEPYFAPYRFVSFQALAMEDETLKTVHFWYDDEGTTVEEIIKNLDNAIDVVAMHNDRVLHRDENSERRS
jgi:hypothetical protein